MNEKINDCMILQDFKTAVCGDRIFKIGESYKHFKRDLMNKKEIEKYKDEKYLYKILNFAKDTETGEILVIYKSISDNIAEVWSRPLTMFSSKVDKEKYPESKQEYRFEKF